MATKKKRKPGKFKKPALGKVKSITLLSSDIRRQAEEDYITDPDSNSIDWHYKRDDRSYKKACAIDTFRHWAKAGKWSERRIQYWEEIQKRLLAHIQDRLLDQRIKEVEDLHTIKSAVGEYLNPLIDDDGEVIRNEETGLPKFGVEMPSLDKLVKVYLDLDLRIALKTGDVTNRTETVTANGEEGPRGRLLNSGDPVSNLMNIQPHEAKALARKLLLDRNARLDEDIIDMEETDAAADRL